MNVGTAIKYLLNKFPYVRRMAEEVEIYKLDYPPGHYHSPIVSVKELKELENDFFIIKSKKIPSINLYEDDQLKLLKEMQHLYKDIPFKPDKQNNLRYYFENAFYSYSDAIFLYLIVRYFKPQRIIEAGSGFSSAVMLDTNETFFNNNISITFIEPFPDRLLSLFKETDRTKNEIIANNLQNVNLDVFRQLKENDILFIDSTHVSKTGSDVNYIIFDILPALNPGVLIHFHDIFYPFEYHKDWVLQWKGFGWNENYILRAFLMFNNQFKIILFNTFLEYFHEDWFKENMPSCLINRGGNIWLKKL
jgi:hypothetical protein